jgi:PAS domain-containing protein
VQYLLTLINSSEDWLTRRTLQYALQQGYTKYTSTLEEAWRLSISGLSASLMEALSHTEQSLELTPDMDIAADPLAAFGIHEARLHRSRGVSLTMFQGLLKYYRQSYIDLVVSAGFNITDERRAMDSLLRFFDRVELGFCAEWADKSKDDLVTELREANRHLTNEKNKYLTIFESYANSVFILDRHNQIAGMNLVAQQLFTGQNVPGATYYNPMGIAAQPWLEQLVAGFLLTPATEAAFEIASATSRGMRFFHAHCRRILDVSHKFSGTVVILDDITERKLVEEHREELIEELQAALLEVRQLSGLLPICAACKNIRNDEGYWQQIEAYIGARSDAQFTHSICPSCAKKLYPDLVDDC